MKRKKNLDSLPIDKSWAIVLNRIKKRYEDHFRRDSPIYSLEEYSPIPFNSTEDHYDQLRMSFKQVLSLITHKVESDVYNMIPSVKTFAEMFRIGSKPKSLVEIHGCYLYATGSTQVDFEAELERIVKLDGIQFDVETDKFDNLTIDGITVDFPQNGMIVPRQIITKGRALQGESVWTVVRAKGGAVYYVQWEGKIKTDGTWESPIYIGRIGSVDIGYHYQMQALIGPTHPLETGLELLAWPDAQCTSKIIEIIRGEEID